MMYKLKYSFMLLLMSLMGFPLLAQSLNGHYTVGGSNPAYATFAAAVADLNSKGISGPVVFEVRPGTYNERVAINQVSGASATNTITFRGAGIDITTVTNAGTNNSNWANFVLNGADYLVLRDMTIATATGSGNFGVGVLMCNAADYNRLVNLKLTGKVAAQPNINLVAISATATSVVATGANTGSFNTIDSCQFIGAYRGVRILGGADMLAAASYREGNSITNCSFISVNAEPISYNYQQGFVCKNNIIGPTGQTSGGAGIYIQNCSNFEVSGNTVTETAIRGINFVQVNTNTHIFTTETQVYNNLVKIKAGYSITFEQAKNMKVYHNNMLSTHLTLPQYPSTVRFTTSSDIDFRNNHVEDANATNGYFSIYADNISTFSHLDYNNYYSASDNIAHIGGVSYPDLNAFKNAFTNFNQNAYNRKPGYVSEFNLRLSKNVSTLAGTYVGIAKDIDGDSRASISPAVGADEIVRSADDAGFIAVTSPVGQFCGGYQKLKLILANSGANTLDSVTIQWTRNGVAQPDVKILTPLNMAEIPNTNTREVLIDSFLFIEGQPQTFKVWTAFPNGNTDTDPTNDTLSVTAGASLHGSYTLGGTNPTFATFQALSSYLNLYGLCGQADIVVRPGIYTNDRLVASNVKGLTALSRLNIIGSGVQTTFLNDTTSMEGTIRLLGPGYISIRDLTVAATRGAVAYGIYITGDYNQLTNLAVNLTGTQKTGIFYDGGHYLFDSVTVNNGATGITSGNTNPVYSVIRNSVFNAQTSYSVNVMYQNYYRVYNNVINSNGAGIWLVQCDNYHLRNNVINSRTYGLWDMYGINSDTLFGSIVSNNMISSQSSTAYYSYNANRTRIWHNSFRSNAQNVPFMLSQFRSVVDFGNCTNIDFRNNHLQNDNLTLATSYVLASTTLNPFTHFDHNNYYGGGGVLARIVSTDYNNLAAVKNLHPQFNIHSFSRDPFFVSSTDLHIAVFQPDMKGIYTGIDFDIDGEARCSGTPEIGADESEYVQPDALAIYVADSLFISSPFQVHTNLAAEPLDFTWYVNGVAVSDSNMLTYTFGAMGSHIISLETYTGNTNCAIMDSTGTIVTVHTPGLSPIADFYAPITIVQTLFTENLQLIDLSEHGPTTWEWSSSQDAYFLPNETAQNPKVWFSSPGYHEICLTASNQVGQSTKTCKPMYIGVLDSKSLCGPTNSSNSYLGRITDDGGATGNYAANKACTFLIDPPCIKGSLAINFSSFDLGYSDTLNIYDGNDNTGVLLASLSGITGAGLGEYVAVGGSMFLEWKTGNGAPHSGFEANWISVPDTTPPQPVADFSFPDTIYTGQPGLFTSTSTGNKLAYQWDFNPANGIQPGVSGGKKKSDTYLWSSAGLYEVTLYVFSGCGGKDSVIKQVVVANPTQAPTANFTVTKRGIPLNTIITLTDFSTQAPDTWLWEIIPAGGVEYVNNAKSQQAHVYFTMTGTYTVKLKVANQLGADSLEEVSYIRVFDYCVPQVNRLAPDMGISRVHFKNIDHQSSVGQTRYYNYFSLLPAQQVEKNETFDVTVSRSTAGNLVNRKIWVDWNQDGDFNDTDELVAYEAPAKSLIFSVGVKVPVNALEGLTIMRIGSAYDNGNNEPCGVNEIGEFEDYPLEVILPQAQLPVITLSGNNPDSIAVFGTYADPGALATDFLGQDISSLIHVKNPIDMNVTGSYAIWYLVNDAWGHTDSVSRLVIVYDAVAPQLTLNGPDTLFMEVYSAINDPGALATDAYSGNLNVITDSFSVNTAKTGTYTLNYYAEDASGNFIRGLRIVIVTDTEAPVLSMLGADTVLMEVFGKYAEAGAKLTDNYCADVYTVNSNLDVSLTGTYSITYSAVDCEGNGAIPVIRIVKVLDQTAPIITLNGNDLVSVSRWEDYTDAGYTVSDNYSPGSGITIDSIGNWQSSAEEGLYHIQYRATDAAGNSSLTAKRIIDVRGLNSVDKNPSTFVVKVYPNPGKGDFNVELDLDASQQAVIRLFDMNGKLVHTRETRSEITPLSLQHLAAGVYQMDIVVNTQKSTLKIVIVK